VRCSGDTTIVARELTSIEALDGVVLTTGSFDVLVEVAHHDDRQLLDVTNRYIRAHPQVTGTETVLELARVK
jgi:Lrp/AsnC family transcriptional regulator for asnA, asnC and gidA